MQTATILDFPAAENSSNFDVSISWGEYKPGLKVPMIRLPDLSLHRPFQSFALSVAAKISHKKKAFHSRMDALGYGLLDFAIFLNAKKKVWLDVDGALLAKYRVYAFEKIRRSTSSKDDVTAEQSANRKIRLIYELYTWAVTGTNIQTPTIGNGVDDSIKSTLPLYNLKADEWNKNEKNLYPECFHHTASSSSMAGQHWATDAELADIEELFRSENSALVAERNIIFMRTIDQIGLRRESANSLKAVQFSDDAINQSVENNMSAHSVQPAKQKFSGLDYFEVPFALAWEINRYIKSIHGDKIFEVAKHKKSLAKLPIFLSTTSNKAMSDKSWTSIFSKAFRAVGAPKGAGCHSIRRKFAEDWFRRAIQNCIDQGLPVSYSDIVAGLAKVLGHQSKLSQEAYRRANSMTRVNTPLDALSEQNQELSVQVMSQAAQLQKKDEEILRLRKLVRSKGAIAKKKISARPTLVTRLA
jgi:hypothetical protein